MWTTKFFLLLLGATTLLAAPPEAYDVCPLNMESLKKLMKNNKEQILREIALGFNLNQADAKKLDAVVSGKLQNLDMSEKNLIAEMKAGCGKSESKITEIGNSCSSAKTEIEALKTSLLAEMSSGFEKFGENQKACKNVEELEAQVEELTRNLTERTENLEKPNEKIKEKEQANESLGKQLKDLAHNLTERGNKLEESSKKKDASTSNCAKAKQLNLTRLETGVYYLHQSSPKSWIEAKKYCIENGMQLATFETLQEMKNFWTADPTKGQWGQVKWVSASDLGQRPGHFLWAEGEKVDAAFWESKYRCPRDFGSGKETCVIFISETGKLGDKNCAKTFDFICELAPGDLPCAQYD